MIHSRLYYLIAFPVAIVASTQAVAQAKNQPPHPQHPITVNGRLHVDESGADADEAVTDQGWARVEQREEGLYVSTRSNILGMVDVLVLRGETLHVLHASGKVSSAVYQRLEDGLWHLTKKFPKKAVAKRLETHGWTASQPSVEDPKASEFFLSSKFLQTGDRILVQWPFRSGPANTPGTIKSFAMSPENWYAVK